MTTTIDKTAKLSELQEQQQALVLESQIHALETRLRHAQEQDRTIVEGWGDLIDPMESLRWDADFFGGRFGGRQDRADARKDGDNHPHFTDEGALSFIRGAGQWIAETDPVGINIIETLTSYAIGTGMTHTVAAKPEAGDVAVEVAGQCQEVVDEFLDRVKWRGDLDVELFRRTRKSGERFVRTKDVGGGFCDVEVCEPSWITEPLNAREIEGYMGIVGLNWKYGVATMPGRPQNVVGYFVRRYGDANDWEYVPAEEMSHQKINVDRGVKRGLPDFYGGTEEWLSDSKKAMRNIVKQAAIQASISLIRKHKPGTRDTQIQSMADGVVEFQSKLPPLYGEGGARRIPTERWYPGKIVDERNFDTMYGPMGAPQGPSLVTVVDAGLRMGGRRWGFPEDMISGNASNNTYASILEAHTPFTIAMKRCQQGEAEADRDVLWRVIEIAAHAGRICCPVEQLREIVTVDVEPPDIEVRDQEKDHRVRKEQHEAGILSKRTWAEQEALDYEKEQENINTEPQRPVDGHGSLAQPEFAQPGFVGADGTSAPEVDNWKASQQGVDTGRLGTGETLNGAQVTAAAEILHQVSDGTTAEVVAIGLLTGLGMSPELAREMTAAAVGKAAEVRQQKELDRQSAIQRGFGGPPSEVAEARLESLRVKALEGLLEATP
jgi:hypothetical protein